MALPATHVAGLLSAYSLPSYGIYTEGIVQTLEELLQKDINNKKNPKIIAGEPKTEVLIREVHTPWNQ